MLHMKGWLVMTAVIGTVICTSGSAVPTGGASPPMS